MKKSQTGFLIVAGILLASLASAASLEKLHDQILQKADIQQLVVRNEENTVILEGQAAVLKDKLKAEEIAADEMGKEFPVSNRITLMPTRKSDEDINLEVAARFRKKASRNYEFNTVSVKTVENTVYLMGQVRDAYFSERAEEAATEVAGVEAVQNKIEILPVSQFDDRLRLAILRRLSRDGLLVNYFVGSRPGINIIVSRSRVTLVGSVNSEVDRVRAASRVRELSGVLSVDNQLQVTRSS